MAEELDQVTETKLDLSITYTLEDLFNYKALHLTIYSFTGGAHDNKEIKSYYFKKENGEEVNINKFV